MQTIDGRAQARTSDPCAQGHTLPQAIAEMLREPREQAFAERLGAPQWTTISSTRFLERVEAVAYAIRAAGLETGDRVVLMSNNRIDWLVADFGILFAGCVPIPVFATLALDQLEFIFNDAGPKLCFVETAADAERVARNCPSAPRRLHLVGDGPESLAAFETSGATARSADPAALAGFTSSLRPEDLALLMYTSGTTGNPKGVMLSHDNLLSSVRIGGDWVMDGRVVAGESVLAALPFAHIFEHADILNFLRYKLFCHVTQPDYLLADLKDVRPRMMAVVPRILERVIAGIVGRAKAEGGAKAKLVPWALGVGREYMAARNDGRKPGTSLGLSYALAQRLVLSKIRPLVGLDRLEFFVSGSAPLHRDTALTFAGMGLPILEGYGLTETAPVCSCNQLDSIRYGSVGRVMRGVEVKLAPDGEILIKGPNVMQGYYHAGDRKEFTPDGYFMSGDIGEFDADGYLYITDRKKELIKTSAGKYVAPGRVEASLGRSIYIGTAFVVGDGRPFPAALIAPNWDLIRKEFAIADDVPSAAVAARGDVRDFIQKEAIENTADLASFEQVRRIALLPRDLTIEDGELSPTLKIKRRVVAKKYADLIESAYAPAAAV
jgi:long-chain acyl-CoA synthetase